MESRRTSRGGPTRTAPAPARGPTRNPPRRSAAAAAGAAGAAGAAPPLSPGTRAACERIWAVVAAIPRGTVTTYGAVAARAGLPKRARFVAFALKAAPAALDLPWHRVVAAGGRIALPATSRACREQCRRLAAEGVRVAKGRATLPASTGGDTLDALLWGAPR
jgi:methylated-DNA-protein-cysteine methyltransferase related protein